MTRRGGETTKRLCIIFMAAAIFCVAMFPGKGFAATDLYGELPSEFNAMSYQFIGSAGSSLVKVIFYDAAGNSVYVKTGMAHGTWYNLDSIKKVKYISISGYTNLSYFYVTAEQDGSGVKQGFSISTVTPPDLKPPVPPSIPTGLSGIEGNTTVDLKWNATADTTGYNVYINNVKRMSVGSNAATITGLVNGTTYTFAVTAFSDKGESEKSASINLTPKSPPPPDTTPPSVPVLQGKPGKGQAVLTWTRSPESDLAGYNLYQDGTKVGNYTTNAATVSGLKNGDAYKFQVTSVDTTGNESAKSNQVTVTPVEKMDVNLIPNGDSIVVQIVSGGTGPYVVNWGAAQKTVDQSQYVIQNLQFDTEYTVTITDANGLTYSSKINTGTEKGYIPPTFPNPQEMFQKMLDVFGTAGTIALAIIGGAIALGIMCVLAMWAWRLLRNWLARAK